MDLGGGRGGGDGLPGEKGESDGLQAGVGHQHTAQLRLDGGGVDEKQWVMGGRDSEENGWVMGGGEGDEEG